MIKKIKCSSRQGQRDETNRVADRNSGREREEEIIEEGERERVGERESLGIVGGRGYIALISTFLF